jgi:hypothetical protein
MGMDRDAAAAAAAAADTAAQPDQLHYLEQQLRQRDETIGILQGRLDHFRGWLQGVQAQVAARDPQIIKNARRLYVGGIPEGTKEVSVGVMSGFPVRLMVFWSVAVTAVVPGGCAAGYQGPSAVLCEDSETLASKPGRCWQDS